MVRLRKAEPEDATGIADVLSASFGLLAPIVPVRHSPDEDRLFVTTKLLPRCDVIVAEDEGTIIGYLALSGQDILHLYVRPGHLRRGVGRRLLDEARGADVPALELWCFQENRAARAFYEASGFVAVGFTDGARTDEKVADVRYRWDRKAPPEALVQAASTSS